MLVGDIMTRDPVTVGAEQDLHRVRELFDLYRFHHLLVLQGGRLVGVVSDRDLLKATGPLLGRAGERSADPASLNRRVHQIMSRKLVLAEAGMPVVEAARIMLDRRVSCLPVVEGDGQVLGIVTWRDQLRALVSAG
jgi:acetoin utilization protein AcuB